MKKLLLGTAALTLAFASCKKDDNNSSNNNTSNPTYGTFKVGSTTYTYNGVNTEFRADSGIIGIAGMNSTLGGSIIFYFQHSTTPPVAGTYRVISADSTEGPGQVTFRTTTLGGTPSGFFESTGAGNIDVTVSITNGKYKVVMPDAPAINSLNDSVSTTVSANVTQK